MYRRGFFALLLILGIGPGPGPGLQVHARQSDSMLGANPQCSQDFAGATVVMCGLDNPRGLAFDERGALYVAEAGRGDAASTDPVTLNLITSNCYNESRQLSFSCGATGAISRLWQNVQQRIAIGLPSALDLRTANASAGPNAVSFLGVGHAYVPIGLWDDPLNRGRNYPMPFGNELGQVVHLVTSGEWQYAFDVASFVATVPCAGTDFCDLKEQDRQPPSDHPDANPFAILSAPNHLLVLDASANALLRVDADGNTSLVATFPLVQPPSVTPCPVQGLAGDSVPTSVVTGPDGAYYVGEHSPFPFYAGVAKVYRVVPGAQPTVFLRGFSTINGIAFDATGENLYVLQYHTPENSPLGCGYRGPGAVIRVHHPAQPDETRTVVVTLLNNPTSIAIGPDGAIYVTHKAVPVPGQNSVVSIGIGEVLRFDAQVAISPMNMPVPAGR